MDREIESPSPYLAGWLGGEERVEYFAAKLTLDAWPSSLTAMRPFRRLSQVMAT